MRRILLTQELRNNPTSVSDQVVPLRSGYRSHEERWIYLVMVPRNSKVRLSLVFSSETIGGWGKGTLEEGQNLNSGRVVKSDRL
ncbi:hypothetical protein PIB30_095867, partial [Stylosanthes scabra]|nr:hypothetical protein [Stylosanthes scabra]